MDDKQVFGVHEVNPPRSVTNYQALVLDIHVFLELSILSCAQSKVCKNPIFLCEDSLEIKFNIKLDLNDLKLAMAAWSFLFLFNFRRAHEPPDSFGQRGENPTLVIILFVIVVFDGLFKLIASDPDPHDLVVDDH